MAKELPYFQFEPAEYLTGDISFCSLAAQGLFTILCSYYWQRSCKLTQKQFLRRINQPDEFKELINENVILIEDDNIIIKFLDEQLQKVTKQSKTNSINGSKGGRPKTKKQKETEKKPKQKPIKSEIKGIREDKIREDNIIEEDSDAIKFFKLNYPSWFQTFEMQTRSAINDYDHFCNSFNDTVTIEVNNNKLNFDFKSLKSRLNKYKRSWIKNQNNEPKKASSPTSNMTF